MTATILIHWPAIFVGEIVCVFLATNYILWRRRHGKAGE